MFYERDFNIWECMVFEATTDPSNLNLETPVNNKGCAVLREGVHKALWKIGKHKGQYKALVQANPCQVIRDNNRDDKIDITDNTDFGMFGINLHRASSWKVSYIVLILAIGIGATYFGRYVNRKFLGIERHDETIKSLRDSLNSFIEKYDRIINEQQFVIDSLRGIKQKTITIYEKAESDFNDSNIISDDSVLRYIAKKIQD